MTILICTTFYIYVLLSINVYRKEIELRFNDGYKINRNIKAPYPIRVMVLFTLVALAANWLFFIIFGEEKTILFGLTGTGYFDLVAYEKFHNGEMTDYIPSDEELQKSLAGLPKF